MTITKDRKTQIIDQFRRESTDTGSPEVQIALLTTFATRIAPAIWLSSVDWACGSKPAVGARGFQRRAPSSYWPPFPLPPRSGAGL